MGRLIHLQGKRTGLHFDGRRMVTVLINAISEDGKRAYVQFPDEGLGWLDAIHIVAWDDLHEVA